MFAIKKLYPLLIFTFLSLLLVKCKVKKEDFENFKLPTYKPEWGLSLVKSDLYLKKFLDRSDTKLRFTEEDGAIVLNYYDTLQIFESDKLMAFKDNFSISQGTELNNDFVTAFDLLPKNTPATLPGISLFDTVSIKTDAPVKYTRLKIKSGALSLKVYSKMKHNIGFTVVFDGITKGTDTLKRTVNFKYNKAEALPLVIALSEIDLSGYEVKPRTNTTGIPYHLTNFSVTRLDNDSPPTVNSISTNDSLSLRMDLKNVVAEELDIDKLDLTVAPETQTDTIHINVFDNVVKASNVRFSKPSIEVKAINSMPINMKLFVNDINLLYPNKPEQVLHHANTTSGTGQLYPANILPAGLNDFTISDIAVVSKPLEGAPNKMAVSIGNAQLSSGKVTIRAGQKIKLYVNAKLPLAGFVTELTNADTTIQDEFPKNDVIERVNISIFTNNNYPIDIKWKVSFLDSSNKTLFTIPKVDEEPYVVRANEQNHLQSLTITKEDYKTYNIETTKKIKYEGILNTSPLNKDIEITTSQFCNIQIVGKVKGNFDLNNTDNNFNK